MRSRRILVALAPPLLSIGCAGALQPKMAEPSTAPPALSVLLLHPDSVTGALRPLGPTESLHNNEPITLEVRVDRPAHVAVVTYAAQGESEEIPLGAPQSLVAAGKPQRFVVERHAPPGFQESELRLFVTASPTPLADSLRQLLHLPCRHRADPGRGDPEGSEKSTKEDKKEDKPKEDKPKEDKPKEDKRSAGEPNEGRGDKTAWVKCQVDPGTSAAVGIRSLVLKLE